MESKVTVLTPNGRRQNVKITPNTTLLQILEEACIKHGFSSDEYGLKHHNKMVSLSLSFRFSGLPKNCLLEMFPLDKKRVAQPVEICVQSEMYGRKQAQFNPDDSVWQILKQLLGDENLETFKSPVVLYMRQEIFGSEELSKTTLKSLGITEGRALLHLLDKQLEELKTQNKIVMVYESSQQQTSPASDDIKNEKPKCSKRVVPGGSGFAITKELMQSLKQSSQNKNPNNESTEINEEPNSSIKNNEESPLEKPKFDWGQTPGRSLKSSDIQMETNENVEENFETVVEPEYHILGERSALIYSLDSIQIQMEDLPDSFYDLTINDLKLILREFKKAASSNEDAPLLTEKLREIEQNNTMLRKMAQYKNCVIRIRFPDRYVLQGIFKPIDKVADVKQFVTTFLEKPEEPFYLFTIPPKKKLDLDKTLLELDFVPNALLYFSFENETENESQCMKREYLDKLTSAEGAVYAAGKLRKEKQNRAHDQNAPSTSASVSVSTGAIPKRFRSDEE